MNHPLLGANNSVRAHFQGAGGKPFPLHDYLALLELLKQKGFDVSRLPVPAPHAFPLSEGLANERDVELHLVEPLLEHLGYTPGDWVRQMPLRMGRGERYYPDYAVLPKVTLGEETARFLVEAKYDIGTRRQLEDAFVQGKSYALRLQASAFILAARQGVWLYVREAGFLIDRGQHWSWDNLKQPDHFHKLAVVLRNPRPTTNFTKPKAQRARRTTPPRHTRSSST